MTEAFTVRTVWNDVTVFWGSHGCSKQRGHLGRHFCQTGCPTSDGYALYGEDTGLYEPLEDTVPLSIKD